nr:uncharacterized protein LOC111505920 [Leptinotarsa decemlineata]
MLDKDLKIVEDIPVPGLPMLVENFLKVPGAYDAIKTFANDYKVSLLVLVGLDASNGVKRDVAVYWKSTGSALKDHLLQKLWNSKKLKGYDLSLSEVRTEFTDIVCLKVNNIKMSRKQLVPLVQDAVVENRLDTDE